MIRIIHRQLGFDDDPCLVSGSITEIVFETHSWSEDNDDGRASGWNHSRLSAKGRTLAAELGHRRRADRLAAVLTSDLRRAAETAEIAFGASDIPVLMDWRLRECNYGDGNGMEASKLHVDRSIHLDTPYPGGESWRGAVQRCSGVLDDIGRFWRGERVLIIGHVATRWCLDHFIDGQTLEDLINADFAWKLGWEYRLSS